MIKQYNGNNGKAISINQCANSIYMTSNEVLLLSSSSCSMFQMRKPCDAISIKRPMSVAEARVNKLRKAWDGITDNTAHTKVNNPSWCNYPLDTQSCTPVKEMTTKTGEYWHGAQSQI